MGKFAAKFAYTEAELAPIVADSYSFAAVLRKLGKKQAGGTQARLVKTIKRFGLDTAHFKRGYAPGNRYGEDHKSRHRHWTEVLVRHSQEQRTSSQFRTAMIESGIPYICDSCGNNGIWLKQKLTLQIDHKDGDRTNNARENLHFLCPNCHSQTPTYGGNKHKLKRRG